VGVQRGHRVRRLDAVGGRLTLEANGDTVKASGVLVLSAADGRPLWAYQRGDPVVGQFSPVLAAGSAVYGLGTGGGGVYDPMPLYAFPPTMT